MAVRSTGVQGVGRCTTSTILFGLGEQADPAFYLPLETIHTWVELWGASSPSEKEAVRRAWGPLNLRLHRLANRKWVVVRGPISSVIAVLQDAGWRAPRPDRWLSPSGEAWDLGVPGVIDGLKLEFAETLREKLWGRIGHTQHATGATEGIDPTVAIRYLARLEKQGKPGEAGMLRTILAGGVWGRHRKWEAGLSTSKLCPRCLLGEDTDLHRYWVCPANGQSEHPDIRRTQLLCETAVREAPELPCFWLRGLVPKRAVPLPGKPAMQVKAFGSLLLDEGAKAGPGTYYGDGSGGKHSADPRIRRCGWSVCQVSDRGVLEECDLEGGIYGAFVASPQTVPRAELWAAIVAIRCTSGDIVYVTDHLNLYRRWALKKGLVPRGTNQDLWHLFWQAIRLHDGLVTIRWTRSHTTADDVLSGQTSVQDHTGNESADTLAGLGAGMHQPDPSLIDQVRKHDGLALQVIKRLVAVNIEAVQASKGLGPDQGPGRPPRGARARGCPLGELVRRSTHSLKHSNGRWLCTECGTGRRWIGLASWLRAQPACLGRPRAGPNRPAGAPVLLPSERRFQVGCTYLHTSHRLAWLRGVFFCMRCGGWCTEKPVILARACEGTPSAAGRLALRRLEKGLPPGRVWPRGH